MKLRTSHSSRLLTASLVISLGQTAMAADIIWSGATTGTLDWNAGSNWTGGAFVNSSTDRADLRKDWTLAPTINLSAPTTANGILFDDTGATGDTSLTIGNGGTAGNTLTLSGTAPSIDVAATTLTISANLVGSVGFTKSGAGILALTGINTGFSGPVVVSGGTLNFATSSLNVGSTLQLNSGTTLITTNSPTIAGLNDNAGSGGSITNTSGGAKALTVAGTGTYSFAGNFTGSTTNTKVGLVISSTGTQTLGGNNTANIGYQSVTFSGGTLVFAKQDSIFQGLALGAVANGNLAGNAGINASAGGTVALGVGAAGSGYFDSVAIATFLDGTHMGASTTNAGFRASSILGFDTTNATAGSFTYSTALAQLGMSTGLGFAKLGAGTLILDAANTYGGVTQVRAGTLQIGAGTDSGSINSTSSITNNAALVFNVGAGNRTVGVAISGSGSLTQNSSGGTLTLSNAGNTYSGDTLVNAGTLALTTNLAIQNSTLNTAGAGVVNVTGATAPTFGGLKGAVNLATVITTGYSSVTSLTLNPGTGVSNSYTGNIVDGATGMTLTKSGLGTQALGGNNTYTGQTNLTGGVLKLDSTTALGSGALLLSGSGVIGLTTASGDFTRVVSATPTAGQVGWVLTTGIGGFAAFGGDRSVNFGGISAAITWGSSGILGAGLVLSHATSDSKVTVVNPINFNGGIRTVIVNNGSAAVDGVLSGALSNGTLIKDGAGVLELSGTGSYGAAQVKAGALRVSNTGAMSNGHRVAVAAGATFELNANQTIGGLDDLSGGGGIVTVVGSNRTLTVAGTAGNGNYSFGGILQDNGLNVLSLTKNGGSTQTLTGINIYTGATTVTTGTLFINGNQSTANGAVGIAAAATLGGAGTVGGATTFTGASIHAPGSAAATVGTQTFSSSVTYGTGTIFDWDLNTPDGGNLTDPGEVSNASTGTYDRVTASGAITGGSAIFRVVLAAGDSFTDAFWNTNKSWNNILTGGTGSAVNLAALFSGFNASGGVDPTGIVAGRGQFTLNGSSTTLNWTAVPEPTSALAGLLMTAGLLRRRRHAKTLSRN